MLRVEDLGVRYGPIAAIRSLSLECEPGKLVALVGPNGAGKSSTMLAIAGALKRSNVSGTITLDGEDITHQPSDKVARLGLSLVPEGRHIFAQLTVRENLSLGATVRRDRAGIKPDLDAMCERFAVLGSRIDDRAGMLSGGEQQQLAIARALMSRPKYVLLDEPSLGLAPQMVDRVFELVAELLRDGIGVVLVEQNVARSIDAADHSILLRHGVVEAEGAQHDANVILEHYFGAPTAPEEAAT